MSQRTEVLGDVIITDFILKVYDKDKDKLILDRYITHKDLGIRLFNEQVKLYHNKSRVRITLYDVEKCTNIESYDSDDNI